MAQHRRYVRLKNNLNETNLWLTQVLNFKAHALTDKWYHYQKKGILGVNYELVFFIGTVWPTW